MRFLVEEYDSVLAESEELHEFQEKTEPVEATPLATKEYATLELARGAIKSPTLGRTKLIHVCRHDDGLPCYIEGADTAEPHTGGPGIPKERRR